MKFTIQKMNNDIAYYDYSIKQIIRISTFAFIDEYNHCIIIVAGTSRKDQLSKYLLKIE